ncbi:MAG TPA: ABC transporter permease, partial [Longimicrobiales bacterium]|nr:ABC transporter permease [Longimicrobiales bacterium]
MDRGYGADLRYVVRVLRRSPGFVAVAVLSLAVGIGANAAMFGVVRGLLMEPLPVEAPHELAVLGWRRNADLDINQFSSTNYPDPEGGERYRSNFSYPVYSGLRAAAPEGVRLFAFTFLRSLSVGMGDAPPLLAGGALVDGHYFSVLGAEMALGRPLTEADDQPEAPLVTVLSHALWMRVSGGDPSIIGRTVRINGVVAEVVGVTDKNFRGLSQGGFFPPTDVTVSLAAQARVVPRINPRDGGSLRASHRHFWLRVMARLSEDVSRQQAHDALRAALVAQPSPMNEAAGPHAELGLLAGARGAQPVRGDPARKLLMLLGVVGSVLLIACVNLATLLLARGVALQREMAVRRALGGGRMRLARQMLLESFVLAGAGTVAGLMLAFMTRGALAFMVTNSMGSSSFGNVVVEGTLDPAVIGVAAALGVLATLLFGLLPALRVSDVDPMAWLKHRTTGSTS